jgi:predicted membrane chloride channel (bestrophin family)
MSRLIWFHAEERQGFAKDDLLHKVSFCNLLVAFSYALKHRLRFEPFATYNDLHPLIKHLSIVSQDADAQDLKEPSAWKLAGLLLGLPMAESNPRKLIKQSEKPLGNIPLEILGYCSIYVKTIIENGTFKTPAYHTQAMTLLSQMHEILVGTDRVLNTPLPIAYSIVIAQISWAYILILPFQLWKSLSWVTIPATLFAAYIILGIPLAGREIENPFGDGVNDLPLEGYCEQIRHDINLTMRQNPGQLEDFMQKAENCPLYPRCLHGFNQVQSWSIEQIREVLHSKTGLGN